MANPEHLAILKQGVEVWNRWRDECDETPDLRQLELRDVNLRDAILSRADLRNARLTHVDLSNSDLSYTILNKAHFAGCTLLDADLNFAKAEEASFGISVDNDPSNLNGANFSDGQFRGANLQGVKMRSSELRDADLRGANLKNADLRPAGLIRTNFSGAILEGANLAYSLAGWTYFINLNLEGVKGLKALQHIGPSFLDIETLYRSGGTIPEVFLRGCGVPETMITYARSLVGQPIQFYSCFISYSTKNQEFADRLHADLQSKGVRCWFAPHDIKGGKKLHEQIDEAIRLYDRLLLILSEDSMSSDWVKTEIAHARQREIGENRQMLFPISLVPYDKIKEWKAFDADTGKDSAREIREYFIPDFSNWKNHDSYQAAFQRLLRDLKAGDENDQ